MKRREAERDARQATLLSSTLAMEHIGFEALVKATGIDRRQARAALNALEAVGAIERCAAWLTDDGYRATTIARRIHELLDGDHRKLRDIILEPSSS